MDEELISTLKYLRLTNLLGRWDHYVAKAQKGNASLLQMLREIIQDEAKARRENARALRLKCARIPEPRVMETFPFGEQPKLNKKKVLALYDAFQYVQKSENLIWIGPTGCGKTGLATSFLIQAIQRGHNGRYVLFPELVAELYSSVADHSEEKVIKRYLAYECLLIDEVGYVEVEAVQVGLFFTLMHRRHKKRSTLITSNLGFSEWRSFLRNDHLAAALIDRLTETSHVFNMKGCRSLRKNLAERSEEG
ncbi:MAG: ATP-binding protein [Planctomycetes bacterium]|nr:ATP-binding protein [Planctomycetota bacterium]